MAYKNGTNLNKQCPVFLSKLVLLLLMIWGTS